MIFFYDRFKHLAFCFLVSGCCRDLSRWQAWDAGKSNGETIGPQRRSTLNPHPSIMWWIIQIYLCFSINAHKIIFIISVHRRTHTHVHSRRPRLSPDKSIWRTRRWKSWDYPNNISQSYPFSDRRDISSSCEFPDGSFRRLIPSRWFDTWGIEGKSWEKFLSSLSIWFYLFRLCVLNGEDKQEKKLRKIVLKFLHIYQHPT